MPCVLPQLEEQFDLPAGTREGVCLLETQIGDVGQVERPGSKSKLFRREGTLIQPHLFFQACHPFGIGIVWQWHSD